MLASLLASTNDDPPNALRTALEAIRKHLGMEVAYISEFVEQQAIFREVDAPGLDHLIKVGDSHAIDDIYCRHILEGRLPELMADTADHPIAAALPLTTAVPIGSHMSVPIRRKDGSAYGMFCCLSPRPNKSLNDRDLQVMRVFADMAASQINAREEESQKAAETRAHFEEVITQRSYRFVYQPIWDFRSARPVGFEILCRFSSEPYRSPDKWFGDAVEAGCGVRLELAVLESAVEALKAFPEPVYISINASPDTILHEGLSALLAKLPAKRIVLEITEHAQVNDYGALCAALRTFREAGGRVAIDDAGAGYASLQHIVQLQPDMIKLDIGLTRAVDSDPARRALAAALIFFARETGATMVAEGIETASEYETLKILGVPKGQGYFLGRPMELASAVKLVIPPTLAQTA